MCECGPVRWSAHFGIAERVSELLHLLREANKLESRILGALAVTSVPCVGTSNDCWVKTLMESSAYATTDLVSFVT